MARKFTSLSFFSGALGLDLGLERAGFTTLSTSEIDKSAQKTIQANRPNVPVLGDIRDYTARDIRNAAGLRKNERVDLVAGGPPCQAFSSAGKRRGFEDDRGNVFLHYVKLALELSPKFIVIENVRGLLSAPLKHRPHQERGDGYPELDVEEQPGGALRHVLTMLDEGGYASAFNLYNAANFGAPQIRERVILIASRSGQRVPYLVPTNSADPEFGLPPWRSFRDATVGLDEASAEYVKFPEKRLKYYRKLKAGENWKSLPEALQKEAMGRSFYAQGGKTGFFRRLAWDKPAPTLVTHPAMPATDLAHPVENRPLSIQEYRRLQGFPDDWVLCGKLLDKYKQIGNAVPVPLGEAVGRLLIDLMEGRDIPDFPSFRYSRYRNTDDVSWARLHASAQSKQYALF